MIYIPDKKLRADFFDNLRRKNPDYLTEAQKDLLRFQHVQEELESEVSNEN